ncbi:histidine kinase [Halobacillus fulvus]|nr:histidine kinase [Halobacillus fulvus]
MEKYLGSISLFLMITFIVIGFVIPQILNPLPVSLKLLLLLFLLLSSFITALLSEKGRVKIIALSFSSLGMLGLVVFLIYVIGMIFFGNFGT